MRLSVDTLQPSWWVLLWYSYLWTISWPLTIPKKRTFFTMLIAWFYRAIMPFVWSEPVNPYLSSFWISNHSRYGLAWGIVWPIGFWMVIKKVMFSSKDYWLHILAHNPLLLKSNHEEDISVILWCCQSVYGSFRSASCILPSLMSFL